MANVNLLTLTQDLLALCNSDTISALTDTEEATQIGHIIEHTYEYLQVLRDWPHKHRVITPYAATNAANLVELTLPSTVTSVESIRYSIPRDADDPTDGDTWRLLEYLDPVSWFEKVKTDDDDDTTLTTLQIIDIGGVYPSTNTNFYVQNDKEPEYWTSFDDELIYFDSYNVDREANIDATTTMILGYVNFTLDPQDDTATIEVPDRDWALFKAMCIARVKEYMHEESTPTANAEARRLLIRSQVKGTTTQRPRQYGINNGRV